MSKKKEVKKKTTKKKPKPQKSLAEQLGLLTIEPKGTEPRGNIIEYRLFVSWLSLPSRLRKPKTQKQLAKKFKVCEDTLGGWKQRDGFWEEVREEMNRWARGKTPDVINALYRRAVKEKGPGHAADSKLWLQFIEDFIEKHKSEIELPQTLIDLIKHGAKPQARRD